MYLTFGDRKKIEELYNSNMSVADIAENIGVAFRTVYTELSRGRIDELNENGRPVYNAEIAQRNVKRFHSNAKKKA